MRAEDRPDSGRHSALSVPRGPRPRDAQGRLRLDRREDALADRDGAGSAAFVPGNPDESEAFQRMIAGADDERMLAEVR